MRSVLCLIALSLVLLCPALGRAAGPGGDVGELHFANSGARAAQPSFTRGLLLLHSFEYDAARAAFQDAERLDPGFALAYWGEALTYSHTLWDEQDVAAARAALGKLAPTPEARQARAPTARERDYLASVEALFGPGTKEERDRAYCGALEALAGRYPDDLDARALYALALLGQSGGKRDVANYMRAAAEAEAVLQVAPRHPGALHYAIHAYDDPVHAPLGLRAARLYGQVAPDAEHARHMPSHIYFALGLWQDAIESNEGSLHVSHAAGDAGYHALLWLEYAYLQTGQYGRAAELVRSLERDVAAGSREARVRLAYARAIWLNDAPGHGEVDAGGADDSEGLAIIAQFAAHDFARGLAADRRGDLAAVEAELAGLEARVEGARSANHEMTTAWFLRSTESDRLQGESLVEALRGVLTFRRGDRPAGIALVRAALRHAEPLEFEYGPPWSGKPLEEVLGELLLDDGRTAEAAEAFRTELKTYPNRQQALEGLRRATPAPGAGLGDTASRVEGRVTARDDLVGVWRLAERDPENGPGAAPPPAAGVPAAGLLIYDRAGYFSQQVIPPRAGNRSAPDAAFAVFGRWTFDAATAQVTQHLERPGQAGDADAAIVSRVSVEGSRLIATSVATVDGRSVTQRLIWERAP